MSPLLAVALAALVVLGLAIGFLLRRRPAPARAPQIRDDVRFTVYRPASVVADRWYELLVYAHRAEGPMEEGGRQADLGARVAQAAAAELGDLAPHYRTATEDAAVPVVRDTQLEFIPEIDGFEFNPPRIALNWTEELHEAEFRMRAHLHLERTTARGRVTVMNGPLIVAQMALVIRVTAEAETMEPEPVRSTATPYRRVFASYSREDTEVVRRLREYGHAIGDRYLIDLTDIRTGEEWQPRIAELIEQADVFQLFWSWNSIDSDYVQREWRHALSLDRPNFVRPVYWEDPLPARPDRGLPPAELSRLHFQRIRVAASPPSPEAPQRAPTRASPRLASAALVLIAAGALGVAVLRDGGTAPTNVGEGDPTAVPGETGAGSTPQPEPPTLTVVIATFGVPDADSTLARFASDFRTAVLDAWTPGRAIALPDGADPAEFARANGAQLIVDARLERTPGGIRIHVRITDVAAGTTRAPPPVLAAPGEPPAAVARRFVAAALDPTPRAP